MSYLKVAACATILVSGFVTAAMADKSTAPGQQIAPGQLKGGPGSPASPTTGTGGASGIAPGKNK